MDTIKNGNIFLIGGVGFGKSPKVYSSFQKAEGNLLSQIRAMGPCGFGHTITCIQIDTNIVRKTQYYGSIKIRDGFKHITIKRDENNQNGCKKTHREKIRISLDY